MNQIDKVECLLAERGAAGLRGAMFPSGEATSLSQAVELAAVRWARWRETGEDIATSLRGVHVPSLEALVLSRSGSALLSLSVTQDNEAAFPRFPDGEVCEVPVNWDGWEVGRRFMLFQERFKTALTGRGLPTRFAHALVGALAEMASNAFEHAESPIPPIASFEAKPSGWACSVTDVGRGVVESLKENPAYAAVTQGREALSLALREGVSRTGEAGRGMGFTTLFKALVDRHCTIRFRSANIAGTVSATSPTAASLGFLALPRRPGFHVAVSGDYPPRRRKAH